MPRDLALWGQAPSPGRLPTRRTPIKITSLIWTTGSCRTCLTRTRGEAYSGIASCPEEPSPRSEEELPERKKPRSKRGFSLG